MDATSYRQLVDKAGWRPRNCVWELTLACDLRCGHCGSRAGKVRSDELSLDECIAVAHQLADLGTELVSLSGGEPTLKKGWDTIARTLVDRGVMTNMVTNGAYKDTEHARDIAQKALAAGMCNVGVSVDGDRERHDALRGPGTFDRTMEAIKQFTLAGLRVTVMTTVSQTNLGLLEDIRQLAIDAGATGWRLQLAKPMGAMEEHRDDVLRPDQLLGLLPLLASLKKKGEIGLAVGDSIGYYGPHDKVLRGVSWRGRSQEWRGCQAGMQAIGIEANGAVKGCLSMQAFQGEDDSFVEGNLREHTLQEIWYQPGVFAYNRAFELDALTGACGGCSQRRKCRGGARCVASAWLGHVHEDPMCYWAVSGADARRWRPSMVEQTAAAAGMALLLATGAVACEYGMEPEPDVTDAVSADADVDTTGPEMTPDYGVLPDMVLEYGVLPDMISDMPQTDYGVFPDAVSDIPQTDYGVLPDTVDASPDIPQTDYGVFPDTTDV